MFLQGGVVLIPPWDPLCELLEERAQGSKLLVNGLGIEILKVDHIVSTPPGT